MQPMGNRKFILYNEDSQNDASFQEEQCFFVIFLSPMSVADTTHFHYQKPSRNFPKFYFIFQM